MTLSLKLVVALFFNISIAYGVNVEPVSNCAVLFQKTDLSSTSSIILNETLREKWLSVHRSDPDLRDTLNWLSENIQISTTTQVLQNVKTAFEKFLVQNKDRPVVFLVHEDFIGPDESLTNKSGAWLTGMIMTHYPQFKKSQVFTTRNKPGSYALGNFLIKNPDVQAVLVDDIGFSGQQISVAVHEAGAAKLPNDIYVQHVNIDRIHVVTSGLSSRAIAEIERRAKYYTAEFVPLIEELLVNVPIEKQEVYRKIIQEISTFYTGSDILFRQTLLTTDYRMADSVSFPEILSAGDLLRMDSFGEIKTRRSLGRKQIPFLIRANDIPYKVVPYLAPDQVTELQGL
jgi:hypothetical protein